MSCFTQPAPLVVLQTPGLYSLHPLPRVPKSRPSRSGLQGMGTVQGSDAWWLLGIMARGQPPSEPSMLWGA